MAAGIQRVSLPPHVSSFWLVQQKPNKTRRCRHLTPIAPTIPFNLVSWSFCAAQKAPG